MRKIIPWVHTSIDGYVDGPGGAFDWAALGPELAAYSTALDDRVDTFLYGRGVWDLMSSWWPVAETVSDDPHDVAYAPIWRRTPKVVFSRTLDSADWNTRILRGDLAAEVAALKAEPGTDLLLTDGSALPAALTRLGLIDEYHIAVHPVVLGGGRELFPAPEAQIAMELVASTPCDGRTVVLEYRRAG
ncbi:MAG TPA: dihydrofolate reductase family protein [Jiangellaceae bacterium]